MYRRLFGRVPTAAETKAGRDFLQAEALKQYEERRAKAKMPRRTRTRRRKTRLRRTRPTNRRRTEQHDSPADGMMAGVVPGAKAPADEKKKMLPVTTFGRYVKILMSSNEFLFVS